MSGRARDEVSVVVSSVLCRRNRNDERSLLPRRKMEVILEASWLRARADGHRQCDPCRRSKVASGL